MADSLAFHMDCMVAMQRFPDKYFDLAVVDPPYGINRFKHGETSRLRKYGTFQTVNDAVPPPEYFTELKRISKNQIIWGYNHLSDLLSPCTMFIFWYKHQPVDTYADGELAWTSFKGTAKCFDYPYFGSTGADNQRIHPAQKPVELYAWIFKNFTKRGDRIIDTHLGSGSSRIAAYDANLDFYGYEINKEYFDKQEERFKKHASQQNLFLLGEEYYGKL